jgi:murein DD-endopeptidase MepM/ murein hydrolase activator NlpD
MRASHGLVLVSLLVLVGCSSVQPQPTRRSGLFARLARMESANGDGRSPSSYSSREDESRPGAVEVSDSEDDSDIDDIGVELRWPLESVHVTSQFGKRGSEFHEGVDLKASTGTSVYAAQSGRVIYAGKKINGYGKLVVIRHEKGIATVYAHNSKILVKHGDRVKKGQKVAISGKSGRVSGPHLHFEIRKGVSAVDPLRVMPKPRTLKASL